MAPCIFSLSLQMSGGISVLWAPEPNSRVKGEESLVPAGNLKSLSLLPIDEFLY